MEFDISMKVVVEDIEKVKRFFKITKEEDIPKVISLYLFHTIWQSGDEINFQNNEIGLFLKGI